MTLKQLSYLFAMAENNFDTHGSPIAGREITSATNVPLPNDQMVCDGSPTAGHENAPTIAELEPMLVMGDYRQLDYDNRHTTQQLFISGTSEDRSCT